MSKGKNDKLQNATHYDGKVIIGLTGNIATGKSAVMGLAKDGGALTIDADKIVHELMEHDAKVQEAIAAEFSSKVRRADGRIDRDLLGQIVFSDPDQLALLESIVHPAVRREVDKRILESDAGYVMIEAIKLLEGDMPHSCHQIWVTRCDRQKQLERLRVCRGMETSVAASRIKTQGAQEEKVAFADVVIDTNGLMKQTKEQFDVAWNRLPTPGQAEAKPRLNLTPEPLKRPQTRPEVTAVAAEETLPAEESTTDIAGLTPLEMGETPEDLQVRRARPNDIPSILLLIQQSTGGAIKMKRADVLAALSERGYFIGQVGSEISTVVGWKIDSQVGRIEEIYIHPPEMIGVTGTAVIQEIQKSAYGHMCQIIVAFISNSAPDDLRRLFLAHGYAPMERSEMANNWKEAIDESPPEDSTYLVKVLLDTRLK
ncbi:MAG TPA: dephospho-CoA kinase [Chloroflexota bacterium]|nr:dephospho-CoA kinase [Chloroflexota bacterium]HUM67740.1 dephospho-CoA kinase [Chloroflexota bacterium]